MRLNKVWLSTILTLAVNILFHIQSVHFSDQNTILSGQEPQQPHILRNV